MYFQEETNKHKQKLYKEFNEYKANFPDSIDYHLVSESYLFSKLAELELKIEALTPKMEDFFPNHEKNINNSAPDHIMD